MALTLSAVLTHAAFSVCRHFAANGKKLSEVSTVPVVPHDRAACLKRLGTACIPTSVAPRGGCINVNHIPLLDLAIAAGFAPLAPAKLKKVTDNVEEAKRLLAAGK